MKRREQLRRWRRLVTTVNVALLGFHCYALWVLATTFAAGLVWWAGIPTVLGPPVGIGAFVFSILSPRSRAVFWINAAVVSVYLVIWIPLIPGLTLDTGYRLSPLGKAFLAGTKDR
jgi:hypothetical protein